MPPGHGHPGHHTAHEARAAEWHPARAALSAALVWTITEFGIRVVAAFLSALALQRMTREDLSFAQLAALSHVPLVIAVLVLWIVFDRRIRAEGLDSRDLGYRCSRGSVAAGLAGGIVLLGMIGGTSSLDTWLFAQPELHILEWVGAADALVILAFLIGNGILGPVVEELAWRGYIQSRLERAWNPMAGLVATALLFAAKHIVVDASLARTTTLIAASVALGLVRKQWGTLASTLVHFTMNFTASVLTVVEALRR